jgi:hypothetical protein
MSMLAVSKLDHKNEDCIVVALITHGRGKGKLYAFDDFYKADMLWSSFTGDVCPSLAGKPKLFIVQVSVQSVRLFLGKCVMMFLPQKLPSHFIKIVHNKRDICVQIKTGSIYYVKCVPCHHSMAYPLIMNEGDSLQIWKVALNIRHKTGMSGCHNIVHKIPSNILCSL